jgi:competence protein ComEC
LSAVIAGITCGGLFTFFLTENLLAPLVAVTFLAIFLRNRSLFFLSLAILLFIWGNLSIKPFICPDLQQNHIARLLSDAPLVMEGLIDGRPEVTEVGSRIYLRVEQVFIDTRPSPTTGRLLVFIGEGRTRFLTGDRVRFSSRIRQPRNYGLPGEFDYTRYLAYRNVYSTAFVRRADDLILIREGVDYRIARAIDALAARIGTFIDASAPATEASILRALLIGDMGYVPKLIKDAYSRAGVNHILSISGFHVGVIALFIFQIMISIAKTSEFLLLNCNLRRFILLLTLPLLTFYLFLSGAAPATSRSVIMIGFYILALVAERELDPINSLLLAALFLLAISPPALFDISFQLSFLALWGIVILTPRFMTPFKSLKEGVPRKLLLLLMASAAAIAATTFPVAYYFHRVSAAGPISNLFIVPLMGYGAVVLGFSAITVLGVAPIVAKPLILAAALLVKVSNIIILFLAKIPALPLFNPSRFDLLLFYLFFCSLTFVTHRRGRLVCCGTLACLCAGSLTLLPLQRKNELTITFFSVGQGESTLITFPNGKRMLIDGGGNTREGGQDVGERLLAPALWRMGVTKIDQMILTHPHPDHLQGLKYVAANFEVGEFWEGRSLIGSHDYDDLHRILSQRQIPVRKITASTPAVSIGSARIEPLAPLTLPLQDYRSEDGDLNNDSIVFRLVIGAFSMLFTGDIGTDTEAYLAARPEQLKCTVLKVPHHGSRYSSSESFLAAAAPETALISAGYRNSFHLPAGETLDNLRRRQIKVYRTDLDGTINIHCDGNGRNISCEPIMGHFH